LQGYDLRMIRFPEVPHGEALVVSASTYVAYRVCPQQAVARLEGRYPNETRLSFRGALSHRLFARHLTIGPIADGDLEQVCREEIGQGLNPTMGRLGMRPSDLRGLISEAGELYARFKSRPVAGFERAEVALEVDAAPGVTLKGTVDAVFGGAEGSRLVDWKTGQLGHADHQLTFYSLVWALECGELPALVEAVSVATGERLERQPTLAEVEACAELVADLVTRARAAFSSGAPVARVAGPWCGYCPVLEDCAEGQAATAMAS